MKRYVYMVVALLATAFPAGVTADDTDIYLSPRSSSSSEPLVMLSLDWRPDLGSTICNDVNSGCAQAQYFISNGVPQGGSSPIPASGKFTFYQELQAALRLVLSRVSGVKIGLMLSHDNANNCLGPSASGCSNGGYVALGFTELHQTDGSNNELSTSGYTQLLNKLAAIPVPQGNTSHPYQGAELFFEFFRYLTGQGIYNAHNGWTDFGTNSDYNLNSVSDGYSGNGKNKTLVYANAPALAWDGGIENGSAYRSPLNGISACAKIFTINFLFQVSNQDNDSNTAIKAAKAQGGTADPNVGNNNAFPELLHFLNTTDLADGSWGSAGALSGVQNVTSFFVVDSAHINTTTTTYAQNGGTNNPLALSQDPATLVNTLTSVFQQILSVSTTFVAASIPANVFNRASIENEVFLGLFQADANDKPSWQGVVKKLQLNSDYTALVDARGQPAVAADGRIDFNALTFWTDATAITAGDAQTTFVGRDGRAVNRGGSGQRVPGFLGTAFGGSGTVGSANPGSAGSTAARTLYYDNSSSSGSTGSLVALNADNATASALSSYLPAYTGPSGTTISTLQQLQFIRGMDALDNSAINAETGAVIAGNGDTTQPRGWLLGDPLHSRPLPINYGAISGYSQSNPAIYIAFGGNDGFVHMLRDTGGSGAQDGREVWAYMPKEAMGIQPKLMVNAPGSTPPHPYGVDGVPVTYQLDSNNDGTIDAGAGDKTYLYLGMRRGGSGYFALDVSRPEQPSFLWKISNAQSDFTELGLTFSTPRVGKVRVGSNDRTVLIFGGGYNTGKDSHTQFARADTSSGNQGCGCGIFVVDASTGALIWKAVNGTSTGSAGSSKYTHVQLVDSIPSDVAAVDTDGDGYVDRLVVGDSGGNIWRADLLGSDPTQWKLTLRARLGYHASTTTSKADDRRFFNAPDIVQSSDSLGAYDAIVIGSGDREDPLDYGGTTNNFFYVIKDRNVGVGTASDSTLTHAQITDVTSDCLQVGNCSAPPDLSLGWKIALNQGSGEKNLARAQTIGGTIYFTTYLPNSSLNSQTCGPDEGSGLQYAVALQNGIASNDYYVNDDSADNPGVPNSARDRFETIASGGIPAQDVFLPPNAILRPDLKIEKIKTSGRIPTYWRRVEQ